MLTKTMERYLFRLLGCYAISAITFDLWMFMTRLDMFVLILNITNKEWVFCYITIGLFEVLNMFKDAK
jgi:hypothetical protein